MINIVPGNSFTWHNPNKATNVERIIEEVSKSIRSIEPFIVSIGILNRTKSCMVQVTMNAGKMHVLITNPQDAVFDLNELENPITPITLSGR